MNKEETERAVKLLEKAIKEDYLSSSEVQEFCEIFKENKVGIFLETGELYHCNKENAKRLVRTLKADEKTNRQQLIRLAVEIATLTIGLLTALLGLI